MREAADPVDPRGRPTRFRLQDQGGLSVSEKEGEASGSGARAEAHRGEWHRARARPGASWRPRTLAGRRA